MILELNEIHASFMIHIIYIINGMHYTAHTGV